MCRMAEDFSPTTKTIERLLDGRWTAVSNLIHQLEPGRNRILLDDITSIGIDNHRMLMRNVAAGKIVIALQLTTYSI